MSRRGQDHTGRKFFFALIPFAASRMNLERRVVIAQQQPIVTAPLNVNLGHEQQRVCSIQINASAHQSYFGSFSTENLHRNWYIMKHINGPMRVRLGPFVELTRELVQFIFSSAWKANSKPNIDVTINQNNDESVHYVRPFNTLSIIVHAFIVVSRIDRPIVHQTSGLTVKHSEK
jgi:hypothetical protein